MLLLLLLLLRVAAASRAVSWARGLGGRASAVLHGTREGICAMAAVPRGGAVAVAMQYELLTCMIIYVIALTAAVVVCWPVL